MFRDTDLSIAFIGGGHITQAMVCGLLAAGCSAKKILVCTPSTQGQKQFIEEHQVLATGDNSLATRFADVVIIAVKPEKVPLICTEIAEAMLETQQQKLVISLAEGVAHARLREMLCGSNRIICAVPNLAVTLRRGMTGLYADPDCLFKDTRTAESLMASLGETLWVQEEMQLADVEATSGSSSAYLYYVLEQMQQIAIEQGLSEKEARNSVLQAAWGAISVAQNSQQSFAELRQSAVQSKSTSKDAIQALKDADLPATLRTAMKTVKQETQEKLQTESI
ncbi:pyrroline-5-carboxylate reductase family protein [Planctobacterium marinum]|uniref:Pyrroline-5-carboxylate reductase n=1 Tax=Planctobacterium marinum TaxID=1631968 RepID=A0AA48HWC2_9ALTE|nr:pyrroline-5-carboxylate reductase [Planctobacterium marinum]